MAVGGPIGYYSASDVASAVKKTWMAPAPVQTGDESKGAAPDKTSPQITPSPQPDGKTPYFAPDRGQTAAEPTPSLGEVLRFDVTADWIMRRWPRVSTGLPHLQLQGYRVPLLTGTEPGDVAGSLTYYFNHRQQVQRIVLRGTTGDPRPLAALAAERFHFVRRLTNDPGVVLYEAVGANHQPVGTLKIRSAGVIKSERPNERFEVEFVADRPE